MAASTEALALIRPAWYRRARPVAYVLLLCLATLLAFGYKQRVEGIYACPASGYGPVSYLSDCSAKSYGDYDHGAFWFGLEPQSRAAAAAAQVLFVGNSRLQFAMSSASNRDWFAAAGISRYLLGFSHSETVAFFGPLLSSLKPNAKVYVLNVDRLFDDRVSPPTEQIRQGRDAEQRYRDKQQSQSVHRRLCGPMPGLCGDSLAIYRARDTGTWQRIGRAPFVGQETSDAPSGGRERWDRYAELAEDFVARLPVDRRCIVLTLVPTVLTKRAEAEAIASRLGMELVSPRTGALQTFDGSHLDDASAERWSAAFLQAAGPRIRQCVDGSPAS